MSWVRQFILFHDKRHPREMGSPEIEAFLTYLAKERGVAANTQNQALAAILFLYRWVLGRELGPLSRVVRVRRPVRLPVVLTPDEAERVLLRLEGDSYAVALLLWGAGLRLLEALRLRVQDVDFGRRELRVRDGKGRRDRLTILPERARDVLAAKIEATRTLHRLDLAKGYGEVELPDSLARKYPKAAWEEGWQYVFPAESMSSCPPVAS